MIKLVTRSDQWFDLCLEMAVQEWNLLWTKFYNLPFKAKSIVINRNSILYRILLLTWLRWKYTSALRTRRNNSILILFITSCSESSWFWNKIFGIQMIVLISHCVIHDGKLQHKLLDHLHLTDYFVSILIDTNLTQRHYSLYNTKCHVQIQQEYITP